MLNSGGKGNFAAMKSIENKTGLIFDLFFCVVLMPLLIFLGPAHSWITRWPLFFVLVTGYLYAAYFTLKRLKLPQIILNHNFRKIGLIAAVLVVLTYILTLYPLPKEDFVTPAMSEYQTRARNYNIALSIWFMMSVVLGYSLAISLVKELYERIIMQNIAENQRNKAELAIFKAQISPHFLFNTLNSLYSLVIGTSQKAEDAFIKFTEILKYTYVTIDNEYVPLSEEVAYIRNYIDLQMIRLDGHTRVVWNYSLDCESTLFPPMIFLTFVENAFKYGSSTSRNCIIYIDLSLKNGILRFETQNSVARHADEFRTEMPVGIENCRNRLAALFAGKHTLETKEDNGIFKVKLIIDLNGYG